MRARTAKRPAPVPVAAAPRWQPPRWLHPAVLALSALAICYQFCGQVDEPDLWWHLRSGQYIWQNHRLPVPDPFSYTTYMGHALYAGEPITRHFNLVHEWLTQVLFYLVYAGAGMTGILLLRALLLTLTCGLVGLVSYHRTGGFYRSLGAAFLTSLVAGFVGHERPYLITFLFLAATIAILEYRRWLWVLPPMFVVWANCHSGYFLGWVALGAYCAETLWRRTPWATPGKPAADERRLLLVTAAAILASGLNPNGFRVFQVLVFYRQSPMLMGIFEWRRPRYWEVSPFTVTLYAAGAALLYANRRARVCDWLLYAVFAAAALMAVRNVILVGIVGALILASYFPFKRALPAAVQFGIVLLLAARLAYAGAHLPPSPVAYWQYPVGPADFLARHHVTGRMFNSYEDGGYLMWRLWPQERVFIDGRDLNESVSKDYPRAAYNADAIDGPSSDEILAKYGIEVIIMPMIDSYSDIFLLPAGLADPSQHEWKLVYQDAGGVVFMRTPPPGVTPLSSLDALVSMESQCHTRVEHGYARCAGTVSKLFDRIGDGERAARWMNIFREHATVVGP